jgi:hypothetical protein
MARPLAAGLRHRPQFGVIRSLHAGPGATSCG